MATNQRMSVERTRALMEPFVGIAVFGADFVGRDIAEFGGVAPTG